MADRLRTFIQWLNAGDVAQLLDIDVVIRAVSDVGLFRDPRRSPHDETKSLYGDDEKHMLPEGVPGGMWQTPGQLARLMVFLAQQDVQTYLEIGTFSGWTITVIVAYLLRVGTLRKATTFDVHRHVDPELESLWTEFGLPIEYVLASPHDKWAIFSKPSSPYDVIFIDGDHSYEGVRSDYDFFKDKGRHLVFHDVNDEWCPGVRRIWQEVKSENPTSNFHEFTLHPNDFRLMGIGVVHFAALHSNPQK
jgi:hypothetical protein